MRNIHFSFISVTLVVLAIYVRESASHEYGKGFFNHTGCLYSYIDGGIFELTTADGDFLSENLNLDTLEYDHNKSKCINQNQPGKIVFSFKIEEESKIKSITIAMRIITSSSEGYWEISQANLTVQRSSTKRTFPLRVVDMYAGLSHSYSCNQLVLHTIHKRKTDNETGRIEPRARVLLERFQLQPFPELKSVVFGPSFDCSTWISIPGLMGLILILFMTFVVIIGVHFLKKIETNEFKNNKEGLQFTQSQMETNKRQ